ncbi:dethiobiotin synthetase [Methylophilaceae bacterium]|nr:dethiobiotin synthetase [Methylophilaceae bacterium]
MKQGYFVTGTDTGVGKTLIAAALIHKFAQSGLGSVGMKPVAAGARLAGECLLNEDVEQLIGAGNVEALLALVNPYVFEPPIAPHIAARQVGVDISIGTIEAAFKSLGELADVVIVEGAGGFLVPLGDTEDMADLASLLSLPVILVVGMRLGCLNHALLTVEAIRSRGLRLAGWVANSLEPGMTNFNENLAGLRQRIDAPCLGVVPWISGAGYQQAADYIERPGSR